MSTASIITHALVSFTGGRIKILGASKRKKN